MMMTTLSPGDEEPRLGSRVVVLNETTANEAAELLQALANGSRTPEAVALDHLTNEDGDRRRD